MEGKYQAYPEYKSSGVEWLGKIPSHWETWKLKHSLNSALLYGANEAALDENKNDPRYIRITDMNEDGSLRSDTFKSLPMSVASSYLLEDGDILLARSGATVGKSFFYQSKLGVSCFAGYLIKASINNEILNSRYAHWFFQSDQYWKYISGSQIQSTIQNVSAEKYGEMKLPFSRSLAEQQKIANFLDHETAKIDTLIEKQQQLIKLLKEKRQAVISHAVTKGLNPDVPMRDSGVEWLGKVPEHWVTCTLRRYADFVDGDRGSEYPNDKDFQDAGIVFLSSKNIVEEKLDLSEVKFITQRKFDALNRGKAIDGDLIVKVRGSVGRIGELAKFQTSQHGYETAFINAQMMIIRTRKGLLTNYLRLISQSLYWTEQLAVGAYGTAQQQLSNDVFANLKIVIPPQSEQFDIENKLETVSSISDALIVKANNAIALLQERRTALISAAVTGKIDVRNWSASNA